MSLKMAPFDRSYAIHIILTAIHPVFIKHAVNYKFQILWYHMRWDLLS